jgi:hypothetical protein
LAETEVFRPAELVRLIFEPARLEALTLRQWDVLLRLARRGNVLGTLAVSIDEAGLSDNVPPVCRPHLRAALALAARQARAVRWETLRLREALDQLGIRLVLLKGAAYLAAQLPFAGGRFFSDVDILVPHARIREVEGALIQHGWATTHLTPYDQRYYRQWMHELPPMRHLKRGTVVDVHHRILPLTARYHPDPVRMLDAAVPTAEAGVWVLAPEDMLLHSATHLFHEGEFANGFRDLVDLDRLFRYFLPQDGFADRLTHRARELQLERPLELAVRYTHRLVATQLPETGPLRSRLSSSGPRMQLMDALYERALRPDHPLLDAPGSALARWLLYVRAHWLRMPPHLLVQHLGRKALVGLKEPAVTGRAHERG